VEPATRRAMHDVRLAGVNASSVISRRQGRDECPMQPACRVTNVRRGRAGVTEGQR